MCPQWWSWPECWEELVAPLYCYHLKFITGQPSHTSHRMSSPFLYGSTTKLKLVNSKNYLKIITFAPSHLTHWCFPLSSSSSFLFLFTFTPFSLPPNGIYEKGIFTPDASTAISNYKTTYGTGTVIINTVYQIFLLEPVRTYIHISENANRTQ